MAAKRIYKWAEWFAKGRFTVKRGRDFFCEPSMFIQQARNVASQRELHLSAKVTNGSITIQVEKLPCQS